MRKFSFVGCAYLLLFCMPLHLSASVASQMHAQVSRSFETSPLSESGLAMETEIAEKLEEGALGLFGPGNRKKKRHKEKKKRMGGHQNLGEKLSQKGIFGKQTKNSGIGQNVLFLVVPAVAVVGLAFLFAASTKNKNADSLLDPDPNGTN
ncbi:MAG: hypothetical protein RIE86_26440 [Imperialibacter sp.]|uniref:hypothetical protein n=1 Tax=Imperialibacter sp. TaxID=2038411 RepID=UPI0032ED459A